MFRNPSALFIVCATVLCAVAASAGEPETADDVIARYVKAIGGQDKLDSIKTIKIEGRSMMRGGMESSFVQRFKRPNKMRLEFSLQGTTGIQAFDGETGWYIMPFAGKTEPEKMPQMMADMIKDQADFEGPLPNYKEKGHKVELVGKEDLEGTPVYRLKVIKKGAKEGEVEYHLLDAEYFVPLKVTGKAEFQGMPIEYAVEFSDYKKVDGLLMAHTMRNQGGPQGNVTITMKDVQLNVELDDEIFAMPETPKSQASESQDDAQAKEPPHKPKAKPEP